MKKILELITYLFGLNCIGLGINICIHTGLGASTWDAASFTLGDMTKFSPGTWVFILGIILTFVITLINHHHINKKTPFEMIGTILAGFIVGISIDFWNPILDTITTNYQEYTYALAFVGLSGIIIMGFGIALYTQTSFQVDPIDNFMMQLVYHQNFSITKARYITDATALIITLVSASYAYIMAIQLQELYLKFGTVIIFVTLSPVIAYFSKKLKPLNIIFKGLY